MMQLRDTHAIAVTRGVASVPNLASILGCPVIRPGRIPQSAVVLAWGKKASAAKAEAYAVRHGLSVLRIEDGFLRSVALGHEDAPLSLVLDDVGIYYDAGQPSRLEQLIQSELTPDQKARAQRVLEAWRSGRISKYCHARESETTMPCPYVLVIDQTAADASIGCGQADAASFSRMLEAALAENPDCTILLKLHPDVTAGRKRPHFDLDSVGRNPRVSLVAEEVHPVSLLEHAEKVYAVTSQMGFEGLLWGKPVHTFGMPFYAGWGLTRDALPAPGRRRPVMLENLVHAALVEYPNYVDPETGKRCEPERVIEWMSFQRKMRERFPARVHACGFSSWKQPIVEEYFQGSSVQFTGTPENAPPGGTVVVWGREPANAPTDRTYIRLEDGFLRSVGLGADLIRPISWVTDREGIYYDAGRPSELERILQEAFFSGETLERATRLRHSIIENQLTKYNLHGHAWKRPEGTQRVLLVPGQVETDAAILAGANELRTNLAVLKEVRRRNPDAYLVYKPHPDVVAGLRLAGKDEENASEYCDELVPQVEMGRLLAAVDEVHVLTSLAGFEALLRGKKVVCYGTPFYAGWKLTEDLFPSGRRTRALSLDELVAGVLIAYPTYISRTTRRFTTPERALQELLEWRSAAPKKLPVWRSLLRWLLRFRAK